MTIEILCIIVYYCLLGKWGGGNPKPFMFTEIQKHRFGLKSKHSQADRQCPAMPLVFYNKQGILTRYNYRKFGELPFHLIRCKQFQDLYDHVIFNYQWLYAKMCACPLQVITGLVDLVTERIIL